MIDLYYIDLDTIEWLSLSPLFCRLDQATQNHLSTLKNEKFRCSSLLGKMIVFYYLKKVSILKFKEFPIFEYGSFGHPFLRKTPNLDFSISHSDNIVICAFLNDYSVGVDIEYLTERDYEEYKSVFTSNELKLLKESNDQLGLFYSFWTLKEAFLKCIGTGFNLPPDKVDISTFPKKYGNNIYYKKQEIFRNKYSLSLVSNISCKTSIYNIDCEDLIRTLL